MNKLKNKKTAPDLQKNKSPQSTNISNRPKRGRESLDNTLNISKKYCDQPPIKAADLVQMDDLKKLMLESFAKAEKQQEEFRNEMNNKLTSIQETFQIQLESLNTRVTALETSHGASSKDIVDIHREISSLQSQAAYNKNRNDQKDVECDVIARGIPTLYSTQLDQLASILNEKLKVNLSPQQLDIHPPKPTRAHTGTFFLKFKAKSYKDNFMNAVRTFRNKDIIALEDLFENFRTTNQAGTEVSFRNSLTKFTKSLLDTAIAERRANKLAYAWERDGLVYMRKRDGDPKVEATSVIQIREFASS